MRPSGEARLGIAALLSVQLATSICGVVLLGRMSPALEQILTDNVYSIEAAEDMMAALVRDDGVAFSDALDRARGNVTETEEVAVIRELDTLREAAISGDRLAGVAAVDQLDELARINRASMTRADENAKWLGLAGAWTMALFGFVGFLSSLFVFRRIEARLLAPVLEVAAVLEAARDGDEFRRCFTMATSPEGGRLMANLNWLLDRQLVPEVPAATTTNVLRASLVALLDRTTDRPVLLAEPSGRLIAANAFALQQLTDTESAGAVARRIAAGDDPAGWSVTREATWVLAEGPTRA